MRILTLWVEVILLRPLYLCTATVWTREELIPFLSDSVGAQFDTLAKQFNVDIPPLTKFKGGRETPSFREWHKPAEVLRAELQEFVREVWNAEDNSLRQRQGKPLDPKAVYDASAKVLHDIPTITNVAPPRFRGMINHLDPEEENEEFTPSLLAFEMDATQIARIFNASLEAAIRPLKNLMRMVEITDGDPLAPTRISTLDE
eukprot:Gregarina_sp_Poly_1__9770@NODE_622_length_7094_cov_92_849580_g477_i0_p6_GENE_NODE_622_length_7094_cov_92_849580_g477_i0NODE_622_length_7094_cov_92_849580_g477_i0_p6_ORF_typecomplete_len202_score36_44_NODE_622_length_7094_cov_92_849580_g477_i058286433